MAAFSAYGSAFTTGNTEGTGRITGISFSGIAATEIDVTSLIDTGKTYVLGTSDPGTVEVTCNMERTEAFDLPTSGDSTPSNFVIRFGPTGAGLAGPSVTFTGYLQSTSIEAAVDQAVTVTYTIRISGAVSVTAPAS
jgi:hypothetical protein